MKHLRKDYHGLTVQQAIHDLEATLMSVSSPITLTIITGRGKIRDEIVNYLDMSDIRWYSPDTSDGYFMLYLNGDEK